MLKFTNLTFKSLLSANFDFQKWLSFVFESRWKSKSVLKDMLKMWIWKLGPQSDASGMEMPLHCVYHTVEIIILLSSSFNLFIILTWWAYFCHPILICTSYGHDEHLCHLALIDLFFLSLQSFFLFFFVYFNLIRFLTYVSVRPSVRLSEVIKSEMTNSEFP